MEKLHFQKKSKRLKDYKCKKEKIIISPFVKLHNDYIHTQKKELFIKTIFQQVYRRQILSYLSVPLTIFFIKYVFDAYFG